MSTPQPDRKRLPVRPSLENLKKRAKFVAKRDSIPLAEAQHRLANEYGCRNWAGLARVVKTMLRGADRLSGGRQELEALPSAANRSDLEAVNAILAAGAFTQHDLDKALARAVLAFDRRREIAEALVEHGADPNGQYGSAYGPIVFVTGECLDPHGLKFLIDHGCDVAFPPIETKYGLASPMSHTLSTYMRGQNERKRRCIEILLKHGAIVPPDVTPEMFAIHRGDAEGLGRTLDADRSLLTRRYPSMPCGNIGLKGGSLLHLAVEFGEMECVNELLERGADINLPSEIIDGVGGQTCLFHAIAPCGYADSPMLGHLVDRLGRRLDVSVRATFTYYGEAVKEAVTPLEHALRIASEDTPAWRRATEREIELLRSVEGT